MANRDIRPGDWLLDRHKQLYRVIDVHTDTLGTYYDIKSSRSYEKGGFVTYKSVPRNYLRHAFKVIPEEKMTKMMKILYG